jgi:hypothetical protein
MSRIWWNLFGKIWIQNVGDIDLKLISAAANSNNFQKTRFWKEKSVENGFTLRPMAQATQVYLWRKVVCFVVMRSIEPECFRSCSWCIWKAPTRRGAWAWFHDIWTCSAKVLEYWMNSSLKIKLNCSSKFWRKWNVPLVLLERSWWAGLNRIYLVRFGFRMWEILIFEWFVPLRIQINSKRPGFERKNQLRTW